MKKYIVILLSGLILGMAFRWGVYYFSEPIVEKPYKEDDSYHQRHNLNRMYAYEEEIIKTGDYQSYLSLILTPSTDRIPYIILMANHYQEPQACSDFYYYYIRGMEEFKRLKMDTMSLKLTLDFLHEGIRLKGAEAHMTLGVMYREGKYVKKDTALADSLIKVWEELDTIWK